MKEGGGEKKELKGKELKGKGKGEEHDHQVDKEVVHRRREGGRSRVSGYLSAEASEGFIAEHELIEEMVLSTVSTDEGEEFHLMGRGGAVWTYSIWAVRAEIERRMTDEERGRLGERRSAEECVRRRSWDSMRGWG